MIIFVKKNSKFFPVKFFVYKFKIKIISKCCKCKALKDYFAFIKYRTKPGLQSYSSVCMVHNKIYFRENNKKFLINHVNLRRILNHYKTIY